MIATRRLSRAFRYVAVFSACVVTAGLATQSATEISGATPSPGFVPGDLLVSTSVYQNDPNIVAGATQLPPGCSVATCATAVASGSYPYVFNNDSVDGSFGVTSPIWLDELTPAGTLVSAREVPNSSVIGVTPGADQMVTSFSSKSELALNLSTSGQYVTFMGYNAPVETADVSNANTPGDIDSTNPVSGAYYRVVGQLGADGTIQYTETNAYSGDNGRAAILNDTGSPAEIYAAGNAGNGSNPEPEAVVLGVGAQILQPAGEAEDLQDPGQPTALGDFNVTELSDKADKSAKDDNFRGIAIDNKVLYYTKGSGSNGVDTVYFVDTSGNACPSGVGLPASGATLPTAATAAAISYSTSDPALGLTPTNPGLAPTNMCILKGFPTAIAKNASDASDYPFGLWFANPTTLYVADEGAGDNTYSSTTGTYTAAAASTTAGLQKWVLSNGQWRLAYTLQSGLNLGQPYTVPGYPTGDNTGPGGSGLPWAPATDGLRNLTGQVNANGTVTIWATTSTVSGGGDQGADPNGLVSISDNLAATSLPTSESFQTVLQPTSGTVVRGVSFTPGTGIGPIPTSTVLSGPTSPAEDVATTYTATVTPESSVLDGGTVDFSDSSGQISACTAVPVDTSTGQATCTVTFVGQPVDTITATYSGDPNFGSSSSTLDISVGPPVAAPEVPWTPLLPLSAAALGGIALWRIRRREEQRSVTR